MKYLRELMRFIWSFVLTKLVITYSRGILLEHDINLFQSILLFLFIFWAASFFGEVVNTFVPYRTGVLIGNDYWSNAKWTRHGLLNTIKDLIFEFILCWVAISLITWSWPFQTPSLPDPFVNILIGGKSWLLLEFPLYLLFLVRLVATARSSR